MNKYFNRGLIVGIIITSITWTTTTVIIKNNTPVDYTSIYAQPGDTIESIVKEEYSRETRQKRGIRNIIDDVIEETDDGVLKVGERLLLPVYER